MVVVSDVKGSIAYTRIPDDLRPTPGGPLKPGLNSTELVSSMHRSSQLFVTF